MKTQFETCDFILTREIHTNKRANLQT